MQTRGRVFDDMARLANGAVGALAGAGRELEAMIRAQIEKLLANMDLVRRDEFEAVKAMAAKARAEQERLEARVALLEARLASDNPQQS
jgi:BMFP domain-containing protein YqiC